MHLARIAPRGVNSVGPFVTVFEPYRYRDLMVRRHDTPCGELGQAVGTGTLPTAWYCRHWGRYSSTLSFQ